MLYPRSPTSSTRRDLRWTPGWALADVRDVRRPRHVGHDRAALETAAIPSQPSRRRGSARLTRATRAKRITSPAVVRCLDAVERTGPDVIPRAGGHADDRQDDGMAACAGRSRATREPSGAVPGRRVAGMIPPMGDRLRPLWDFDDLDASEARFLAQLGEETTDAGRAEVLTQLARVEGLRGEFGRLRRVARRGRGARRRRPRARSSSAAGASARREATAPGSRSSCGRSSSRRRAGRTSSPPTPRTCSRSSTTPRRGRRAGSRSPARRDDPGVRYWLGPLYNNIGWTRFEAGDHAGALEAFELALAARERRRPARVGAPARARRRRRGAPRARR